MRFLFRVLGWSMSAAVALVVLLYVAMPSILRIGIPHALSRYGIASSIESARVDIGQEKITLVGFNIGPEDGPGVRWGEVVARVDMNELLKGNIRILDFKVKDARVDLKQLAAVKWDAPAGSGNAVGEAPRFDVGTAVIQDLKFVGLSETLGRPVLLKTLRLGSLSKLNTGDQIAFQLDATLGDAPLKLGGTAVMKDDLPIVSGRYEFSAFTLDGLAQSLGVAATTSVRGSASGSGDFGIHYESDRAAVMLTLNGRLASNDLGVETPLVELTDAGLDWDGMVSVDWPVGDEGPTVEADGSAAANRVVGVYKAAAGPVRFESDGLRWNGKLGFKEAFFLGGDVAGEALEVSFTLEAGEWRVRTGNVSVNALSQSPDEGVAAGAVTLGEARLVRPGDDPPAGAVLTALSFTDVRTEGGGVAAESVVIETGESVAPEGSPARGWKIAGLGTSGISISDEGRIRLASIELGQGQLDLPNMKLSVTGASAAEIDGRFGDIWRFQELAAGSFRQKEGDIETWASGLRLAQGRIRRDGEIALAKLNAQNLTRSSGETIAWELTALAADGIGGNASAISLDNLTSATVSHRIGESGIIEAQEATASDIAYQDDAGIRVSALKLERLRHVDGEVESLSLERIVAGESAYNHDGTYTADGVDVAQLVYTSKTADSIRVERISLAGVGGAADAEIEIRSARAGAWTHDRAAGPDADGKALALANLKIRLDGAVQAESAELESIGAKLGEGFDLSLTEIEVRQPAWNLSDLTARAGGLQASELRLQKDGNRRLSVFEVHGEDLEPAADGGHALGVLRAARAEAVDEVVGTRLDARAMELAGLDVSAKGRIGVQKGTVQGLKLMDTRGDPAASFFAREIALSGGGIDPGALVDLGNVRLKDVESVIGFSEFNRFVLPKMPFSGGEASTAELSVARLETEGEGRLSFFDRSTSPPFELALSPFSASVERYHSGVGEGVGNFAIEGRVDEFSTLSLNGRVAHKKAGLDLEVDGKVVAFELRRLNTYAAKHANQVVTAGRGDASFNIEISGKKLSGKSELVFSKLKFDAPPASADTSQAKNLSLDRAFALLKDKNEVVKVSVPLSGSLDDPQFDFSDAVAQGVVKTVQNTVMLTFKPLGLLVSVAGLVGVGEAMRFNPVGFDAGEGNLNGQGLTYLDSLARQLKTHPKVDLKICGRAVPADLTALEKGATAGGLFSGTGLETRQRELAEIRAQVVRQYLEQKKGIDPVRLIACAPEVETTAGSLPRADLLVRVDGEIQPQAAEPKAKGTAN